MIAHLSGEVLWVRDNRIVLDVNGVGYEVFAPAPTCLSHAPGDTISLHVHTLVREDAFQLFGFDAPDEKDLFLLITGVSGVGAKLALALLSEMPVADFVQAVRQDGVTRLTRVSGIGKKTAERLCLELKDKVLPFAATAAPQQAWAAGAAPAGGPVDDAVSALVNLGYARSRADAAVSAAAADTPGAPLEELVRRGLAALGKGA